MTKKEIEKEIYFLKELIIKSKNRNDIDLLTEDIKNLSKRLSHMNSVQEENKCFYQPLNG